MNKQQSSGFKVELTQAENFAIDVQEAMQEKGVFLRDLDAVAEIIKDILPNYPGHEVSDSIIFSDRSTAALTDKGFKCG